MKFLRNMASSVIESIAIKDAVWTNWTTVKAVREGYKVSGWVYKAVDMKVKPLSSVPWRVETPDGKPVEGHHLTALLKKPNPSFSRQDVFELVTTWQQLSGVAHLKRVFDSNGLTRELWPVSPDRIAPKRSVDNASLVGGFQIIDSEGVLKDTEDYTVENMITFKFLDPSDPILGVGPLQVAARAVDVDVDQQKWNKSAMQNRGVLDSVFTFERDLDKTVFTTIKQRLKEMMTGAENARGIGVVGSNAKYQRLSLTPAEMDFIASRNFNRDEIFMIFGIPLPLTGSTEVMTYNNYEASLRILWELTLIPVLDDMKDTLNRVFEDELNGLTINYDVSNVQALKQNQIEEAKIVGTYHAMGVPMKTLNTKYSLGIEEYPGWEQSHIRSGTGTESKEV